MIHLLHLKICEGTLIERVLLVRVAVTQWPYMGLDHHRSDYSVRMSPPVDVACAFIYNRLRGPWIVRCPPSCHHHLSASFVSAVYHRRLLRKCYFLSDIPSIKNSVLCMACSSSCTYNTIVVTLCYIQCSGIIQV